MIEHLLAIRANPDVLEGICIQLASRLNLYVYSDEWKAVRSELEVHFKSWAHFSGDAVVPVPDPDPDTDLPFFAFISHVDLWDTTLEYGRLRWHLLEHLINEYST